MDYLKQVNLKVDVIKEPIYCGLDGMRKPGCIVNEKLAFDFNLEEFLKRFLFVKDAVAKANNFFDSLGKKYNIENAEVLLENVLYEGDVLFVPYCVELNDGEKEEHKLIVTKQYINPIDKDSSIVLEDFKEGGII